MARPTSQDREDAGEKGAEGRTEGGPLASQDGRHRGCYLSVITGEVISPHGDVVQFANQSETTCVFLAAYSDLLRIMLHSIRSLRIASSRLTALRHTSNFSRPSPPALPAAQQREFEDLLKKTQTPLASPDAVSNNGGSALLNNKVQEFHPDIRRGPPPQFEGDVNPKTGEVGGPKTEPVAWNEWSYGGRATDF